MPNKNIINVKINIDRGKMCLTKGGEDDTMKVPIDDTSNDAENEAIDNIRVELSIAKIFHKVLNFIRSDKELFQKEDFELLGEMLSKILFGKKKDDNRNYLLRTMEQELEINNPDSGNICRIYLEFDYKSGVAMLPWEYLRYKCRTNDSKPFYIAANTKSRFHLMRRVKRAEYKSPEAERLFFIVLINADSNQDAEPAITGRQDEVREVKKVFESLKKKYTDRVVVAYIESATVSEIQESVESLYKTWKAEYNTKPVYVLHYLGHATMQNQVGRLVLKSAVTDKPDWVEDRKFATFFSEDILDVERPVLACFQACDSAKVGSINDTLRGVAYEFTKLNIPAVVGMQNEIDTLVSNTFFQRFYENILEGNDVAEAVTVGRDFLGKEFKTDGESYKNNWFGSPVLFITTEEPIRIMKQENVLQQVPHEQARPFTTNAPLQRTVSDERVDRETLREPEKVEVLEHQTYTTVKAPDALEENMKNKTAPCNAENVKGETLNPISKPATVLPNDH